MTSYTEKKVVRRFSDNLWPYFSKSRSKIPQSGIEKLCSSLLIDYFIIIKKVIRNDLNLAAEKMICSPKPGFKISVKTKLSQEILNKHARIYACYDRMTSSEFLEIADVTLSICYIEENKHEVEVITFNWSDFKLACELESLRFTRTRFGFENPEIAEYLAQLVWTMSENKAP